MSGKAFKGRNNSCIPRTLARTNVIRALDLIRDNPIDVNWALVGNTCKTMFNDIDVAIDEASFWRMFGFYDRFNTTDDYWLQLKTHLEKLKTEEKIVDFGVSKGWKQCYLLVPLVDEAYYGLKAYGPDGKQGPDKGFIQIDLLIGNIEWMSSVLSSAESKSQWKALYRTNLLADAINSIHWVDNKAYTHRLHLDFNSGIYEEVFTMVPPTGKQKIYQKKVVSKRLLSCNQDDVARILFGPFAKWHEINCFEDVWSMMCGTRFRYKRKLEEILNKFKTRLEKEDYPVPVEVMEALGLPGGSTSCLVSPI